MATGLIEATPLAGRAPWRAALALLTSLALGAAALAPASAQTPPPAAGAGAPVDRFVVGEQGLALYPRWNKAFPPLAQLQAGQTLVVLRTVGAWKQVRTATPAAADAAGDAGSTAGGTGSATGDTGSAAGDASASATGDTDSAIGDASGVAGSASTEVAPSRTGWVWCEFAQTTRTAALSLPVTASPTTSGLVVKGFSPEEYARRAGVDPAAVAALVARPVDFERFARFLAEDPVPVAGPCVEPAPVSAAVALAKGDADRRAAASSRAQRMAAAKSASERLAALTGRHGDTVAGLEGAKQGLAGRAALEGDVAALLGETGALALGQGVAARILAKTPEVQDEDLREYVRFVGLRLADHVPGGREQWWFGVVESEDVNAWSTSGGFVFVSRAAVEACANEAQLAALLAHEMAHVAYGHALASLDASRHQLMVAAARTALTEQLPETDPGTAQLVDDLVALGDELLAQTRRPFGHVMEHEADGLSMRILQDAGYDPHEAVTVLRSLARSPEEGRVRGRSLGSHPPPSERLLYMRSVLLEEGILAVGSLNQARFRRHVPLTPR